LSPRILIYGYGNPGRLDDGLGPAFARELAERDLGGPVTIETGYQLNVEDAELVADHDLVVFADADAACPAPFMMHRLQPHAAPPFSTHSLEPEGVLALAQEHFACDAAAFTLGIRGYEFDGFGETLSPGAERNLAAAADYMSRVLRDGGLSAGAASAAAEGGEHVRG
jgi:hydrogenase maturation protease